MKTTNRIIINSYGVDDLTACILAKMQVEQGKISDDGRQYCLLTVFTGANGERIVVSSKQRGNTNIFTMYKE